MKNNNEQIEKKIIINQYRSLIRNLNPNINSQEKKRIRAAFNLAIKAHSDTRRKSGDLFITHPISVAKIVARDIGLGSTSIICSLLHDVVSSSDSRPENFRRRTPVETVLHVVASVLSHRQNAARVRSLGYISTPRPLMNIS